MKYLRPTPRSFSRHAPNVVQHVHRARGKKQLRNKITAVRRVNGGGKAGNQRGSNRGKVAVSYLGADFLLRKAVGPVRIPAILDLEHVVHWADERPLEDAAWDRACVVGPRYDMRGGWQRLLGQRLLSENAWEGMRLSRWCA